MSRFYGKTQRTKLLKQKSNETSISSGNYYLTQIIKTKMVFMAGERYIGCEIPNESVRLYIDVLYNELGEELANKMCAEKANRDRGYKYHATIISPPEMKDLNIKEDELSQLELIYEGLGKAVNDNGEAWFIVCSSPQANAWRKKHGLPNKDIHITLAFKNKDVFNKPKDKSSIIIKHSEIMLNNK